LIKKVISVDIFFRTLPKPKANALNSWYDVFFYYCQLDVTSKLYYSEQIDIRCISQGGNTHQERWAIFFQNLS